MHSPVVGTIEPSASMRRFVGQVALAALPDVDPSLIDDAHEPPNCLGVESPAEVPGRGRVGDGAGAEHVQEGRVVTTNLDVVQNPAAAQDIVESWYGRARFKMSSCESIISAEPTLPTSWWMAARPPYDTARVRSAIS